MTCIFSAHYLVAKIVLREGVDPLAFAGVRGVVGGLCLLALYYPIVIPSTTRFVLRGVFLISLFGYCINMIFFMQGLSKTTATNVALISNTIPLVSSGMAILLGMESISLRKGVGLATGFLGLAGYLAYQYQLDLGEHLHGNLFVFINVLLVCIGLVLTKKILKGVPPETVTTWMLLLGGAMLITLSAPQVPDLIHYSIWSPRNFGLMVYECAISTAIVYLLNFKALQHLNLSTTTVFIYLQTPITALFTFFFLGASPSLAMLPTFLLVVISSWAVITARK